MLVSARPWREGTTISTDGDGWWDVGGLALSGSAVCAAVSAEALSVQCANEQSTHHAALTCGGETMAHNPDEWQRTDKRWMRGLCASSRCGRFCWRSTSRSRRCSTPLRCEPLPSVCVARFADARLKNWRLHAPDSGCDAWAWACDACSDWGNAARDWGRARDWGCNALCQG
eukprot:1844936-Rhodomonas_salina.7